MKAISVRQPWATLIVEGEKTIENRAWSTNYRGPLAIHAGKTVDRQAARYFVKLLREQGDIEFAAQLADAPTGGVIGIVDLVDVWTPATHPELFDNGWYDGSPYVWIFESPSSVEFFPVDGRLKLFDVEFPA